MNTQTYIIKIAIVDDDRHNVSDLSKVVVAAGFEAIEIVVGHETSLASVLEKIANAQVVLLDHQMHRFSGADVARYVPKSTIIITTSGHAASGDYLPSPEHRIYNKEKIREKARCFDAAVAKVKRFVGSAA